MRNTRRHSSRTSVSWYRIFYMMCPVGAPMLRNNTAPQITDLTGDVPGGRRVRLRSRSEHGMAEGEPMFFGLLLLFAALVILGILGNSGYFGPT